MENFDFRPSVFIDKHLCAGEKDGSLIYALPPVILPLSVRRVVGYTNIFESVLIAISMSEANPSECADGLPAVGFAKEEIPCSLRF